MYQSCVPLGKNSVPTQVIQTQKVSFVNDTNPQFNDTNNNCWYYLGMFDSTYIPPTKVLTITYTGNFFDDNSENNV